MKVRSVFLCLAVTWIAAVQAGTVVHLDRRGLPDGQAHPNSVIYAQDGQFRMDTLDEKGHVREFVLVREGTIWQVDVEKRTFFKFDKAALAAQQDQMQERMQAMLQSMPPERRAKMEERMKGMMQKTQETSVTATNTGRGDRAGSWSCEVWQLERNGKAVSESCIASRGSLTGGDELVDATHKASAAAAEVLSSLPAARAAAQRFALYGKVDGFPVRTREISGGKAGSEDIVTSIERQSLAPDKFAIPKGFNETTLGAAQE
jgi:Domain of unknown function (DUF4412)